MSCMNAANRASTQTVASANALSIGKSPMRLVRNFRTLTPRRVSSRLLHWPLALLFLYSGSVKILRLPQFAQSVGEFGIVLDGLVKPSAFMVCSAQAMALSSWGEPLRRWPMPFVS